MDWADYLRDEAAKYRQLAEAAEDPSIKQELLDLAAVCEEAADKIEDRMASGGLLDWWRRGRRSPELARPILRSGLGRTRMNFRRADVKIAQTVPASH